MCHDAHRSAEMRLVWWPLLHSNTLSHSSMGRKQLSTDCKCCKYIVFYFTSFKSYKDIMAWDCFPYYWFIVRGIHQWQVDSSKGQQYSFVYTSGHCRRWRSRMEVKIMAGSWFVHCKIAIFYSVTAVNWFIVSLPNFVTIRKTHFSISCKIFSWIRLTKLKIHAMEFCDFIKDSVSPSGLFVPCSLTVTSTWRPRLTAHCPIGERH